MVFGEVVVGEGFAIQPAEHFFDPAHQVGDTLRIGRDLISYVLERIAVFVVDDRFPKINFVFGRYNDDLVDTTVIQTIGLS